MTENKSKDSIENKNSRFKNIAKNTITTVIGIPTIILFFILWLTDRFMHLILFHATHPKLTEWLKTEGAIKHTITRIILFSIPVILYKMLS